MWSLTFSTARPRLSYGFSSIRVYPGETSSEAAIQLTLISPLRGHSGMSGSRDSGLTVDRCYSVSGNAVDRFGRFLSRCLACLLNLLWTYGCTRCKYKIGVLYVAEVPNFQKVFYLGFDPVDGTFGSPSSCICGVCGRDFSSAFRSSQVRTCLRNCLL